MPQTKRTVRSVLGGLLGLVGLSAVAGLLVTASVTPALAMAGFTGSQALTLFKDLPTYLTVDAPMAPTTVYGNDGNGKPFVLAKFYEQNRVPVTFEQVSTTMYDAILSSEDKNFYSHGGVNLGATVKAAFENFTGQSSRGASTISQQYVKNVLIQNCERGVSPSDEEYDAKMNQCWLDAATATGSAGIERKLREMRYAIQIEKEYSKNDILLGYLNVSSFGGQTYGIEAAAYRYFGTSAKNVTLVQAATLAGMVQQPNALRIDLPEGSITRKDGTKLNGEADGYAVTKERRDYVLLAMLKNGNITQAEYDEAVATPIVPDLRTSDQGCATAGDNAYFCQYVKSVLENDEAFGSTADERAANLKRGGMQVYTTLDLRVQQPAVQAVRERVPASVPEFKLGAAGVSIEAGTGRVLSIVQNTTFSESASEVKKPGVSAQVFAADRAHNGGEGFQPGSTYKLFTLIDWLENGRSVNEVLDGRDRLITPFKQCGGTYNLTKKIGNFGGGSGSISSVMRFTAQSLNTGFLAMAQQLDLCDINKVAKRMGVTWGNGTDITSSENGGNDPFGTVLGSKSVAPLQMANAYATVASGGKYCEPRAIDKVIGQDGKEIPVPKQSCTQVLTPEVAATAAYALRGVMTGGTGQGANPFDGVPVIGKTGTAELAHTMLVESSTKVATAVWVGNTIGNAPLNRYVINGTLASNIRYGFARDVQRAANAAYGGDQFPQPAQNLIRSVLKDLPNVVGQTIDQATTTLEAAGFSVQVGAPVDGDQAADIIVQQDPAPGRVAGGTTVTISPSNGKGTVVPDVSGRAVADAQSLLAAAGYTNVRLDGSCEGGGNVQGTNPSGGSRAPKTTEIRLMCDGGDD